jgi:hypothetical protein
LPIRILVSVQIIAPIIVLRRITGFSIISWRIVVAIAVFLAFFSRLIVNLRRPRPIIAPSALSRTDGLPSAWWILLGLSGILTPVAAVPSLAFSVIVIVLGHGKICRKKQDQTGP